ncbi:MAG: Vitamin B12 dependent methionine synthase activation subunit [Stomatobaculum sp.]|nr:Vitamin B12 dependent methionine synthase activation subunit [Stomatobaculum sp.]
MGEEFSQAVPEDSFGRVRREMYRYMGYGRSLPEPEVEAEAGRCLSELLTETDPKTVWRRFPLELPGEDRICIAGMEISSKALRRNLEGCREVFLMAATLGLSPDRMTARAQAAGKMSRAVMLQAAAAALIEEVCDRLNEELRQMAAEEGKVLRPRFSPGYGDFSLEHQKELFRILEVQKRIGVTLTEHLLMMPSKSVTAVIGIADAEAQKSGLQSASEACTGSGCGACDKKDCSFRRYPAAEMQERSHQ